MSNHKHKNYKGIRGPSDCFRCRLIYLWRKFRKFFRLRVAEAKPRVPKPITPTAPSKPSGLHVTPEPTPGAPVIILPPPGDVL